MKKCRSCSLPDRRLLPAKGKLPMCKSTYFFIGTQQPCHADAGLFGGMKIYDSTWSIYACGLAVPCLCLVYTFFMSCLYLVYA